MNTLIDVRHRADDRPPKAIGAAQLSSQSRMNKGPLRGSERAFSVSQRPWQEEIEREQFTGARPEMHVIC